jgi:hypothetical protein
MRLAVRRLLAVVADWWLEVVMPCALAVACYVGVRRAHRSLAAPGPLQ